jgi:hypothetical protein
VAAVTLTPDDLNPFLDSPIPVERAVLMIEDAIAIAATVAPCIATDAFTKESAARAIIRGAILRWHVAGNGSTSTQQAGPFAQGMTTPRKGMFWPSEITDLQALCSTGGSGAFSIDTLGTSSIHAEICSLTAFGANYCSCGADLTLAYPLYEV